MNYKDILHNPKVIEAYDKIDSNNTEPFNHGLKHINNVCEIIMKLCEILEIDQEEKEALLIAIALHDIGQVNGKENHAKNSLFFTINNFKSELEKNKYCSEILQAIEFHDSIGSDDDSLFVLLVRFSDKMDFTKNRLEDNYREKYDYIFTEKIDDVKFIFDENYFGLDIITSDICDFEEQFLSLEFFHKVIYLVKCLANKLNRKPIIMNNGIIMKKIIFDE